MNAKEFARHLSGGGKDLIQILLEELSASNSDYCVIGGLAVNAYVEPVVSLDLDIVVVAADQERICVALGRRGMQIEKFPHSLDVSDPDSDVRIQFQTDARYQDFIQRARRRNVLGYDMLVAAKEDVLQGKAWAYLDETRRKSKRQKDLADIMRLDKSDSDLAARLPDSIRKLV